MVSINGWRGRITSHRSVGVPIAVYSRVQQVHSHEILRVGNGIEARTNFSLGDVLIRDARRRHHATAHRPTLVIAIRVEPGTRATQVGTPVVAVAITGIHARSVRGDVQVSILDIPTDRRVRRARILRRAEVHIAIKKSLNISSLGIQTIRQPLHRIIRSLQNVRRRDLPLRIGLSDKRLEVGIGRHRKRVDRSAERPEELRHGDRHVGHIGKLLQIGVDKSG